jgi:murein DD-endopeptidase MepM/ murein hydrolase activator NlpD
MLRHLLALVLFASLIPEPPPASWQWPTEGPRTVLRDFQAPLTPWGAGHRGLDLAASGTAIRSPVSGVVTFSGLVVNRGVITITTDSGQKVSLEPVEPLVSTGTRVSQAELIATLAPGHCARLCVHIGLRTADERYRSPRRELGVLQRAVLVPWGTHALG